MSSEELFHTALHPCVVVPARDEERRLPELLAALALQDWIAAAQRQLPVIVVLNNCSDGSRSAVEAAMVRHPELAIRLLDICFDAPFAHVGSARRLGMQTALAAAGESGVILTTDADAVPPSGWVAANLRHIASGIDLVGGRIIGDEAEEEQLGPAFRLRAATHQRYGHLIDRLASLVDPQAHDPWPRHHDHTGASLAVRADVYGVVGGMPALASREDVAFVGRVRERGYLIRHPVDVSTHVSARLAGRAKGGMADCLKDWMRAVASGAPLLVEDPSDVLERLHRRRCLRRIASGDADGERDPTGPAGRLREHHRRLLGALLVERVVPYEADVVATVPAEVAIDSVERMIRRIEGEAHAA